ncbi:MAG: acetyl-coenzyme A synthetase, partial [Gemmatimonadota bacterium]|nr:acetyl-coenzyme A synthetase [Gemmatimonadota bacterium]
MARSADTLDTLLQEDRRFPPPAEFARRAHVSDRSVYERAEADPEAYWAGWAEELHWFRRWDRVLDWNPPQAEWFVGGKLNAAYNCLD